MAVFLDTLPEVPRALVSLKEHETPKELAVADLIWDTKGVKAAVPAVLATIWLPSLSSSRSPATSPRDHCQLPANKRTAMSGPYGRQRQKEPACAAVSFPSKVVGKGPLCLPIPGCALPGNGPAGQRKSLAS
jgi:hypothetical protein